MEITPVVSFNSNTPADRRRDGGTDVKGGRTVNDVKDIRGGAIKKICVKAPRNKYVLENTGGKESKQTERK